MTETTDLSAGTAPEGGLQGTPLAGQHALVTGATRGIGAAIAGNAGASRCRSDPDRPRSPLLDERAGHIAGTSGVRVHVETADVSDSASIGTAFESSVAANGPITILVNNAAPAKARRSTKWSGNCGIP